jgi:hypothetical protein
MVNGTNPWLLVGPWYSWPKPGVPATGRTSAPFIQKYETADFVNEFLKNPRHSLTFIDTEDQVFQVTPRFPPILPLNGKKRSLSDNVMQGTGTRKLFLDTHKRFYLVVCELHCDTAGFPTVDRNDVCETGFVIRRRYVQIPKNAEKPLRSAIRQGGTAHQIQVLATNLGVDSELQGWIPSRYDRVGSWQKVEETPAVNNTETVHPLYPLIPDPALADHAGKGRNIYFGVIPTGGADSDELGNARFDDRNLYEIRCFVRRHKFPCPKKKTRNDCNGPLVWSLRTEPYQLASHFDLVGTSNRPVSIQMPDLPALQAQVAADPAIGRKAPMKMISPKASNLETQGTIAAGLSPAPGSPGAAICSFSIPLVTIVATFVFKLFLPIVVLIFQLWWMLALKFCIPPSFALSADVAAKLSANADADADANFATAVKADIGNPANLGPEAAARLDAVYSPGVQAGLAANLSIDLSPDLPPDVPVDPTPQLDPNNPVTPDTSHLPKITANLHYLDDPPNGVVTASPLITANLKFLKETPQP